MVDNFAFELCRGCLAPEFYTKLSSLFDANTNYVEKLLKVSSVDISIDYNINKALMCDGCLEKLEIAFNFGEKVTQIESILFASAREQKLKVRLEKEVPDTQLDIEEVMKTNISTGGMKRRIDENKEGNPVKTPRPRGRPRKIRRFRNVKEVEPLVKDRHSYQLKELTVRLTPTELNQEEKTEAELKNDENTADPEAFKSPPPSCEHKLINKNDITDKEVSRKLPPEHNEFKLKIHRRLFVNKKFQGFVCNFKGCGRNFLSKITYNRHKTTHSDTLPFACRCGCKFKLQRHLNCHQKRNCRYGNF